MADFLLKIGGKLVRLDNTLAKCPAISLEKFYALNAGDQDGYVTYGSLNLMWLVDKNDIDDITGYKITLYENEDNPEGYTFNIPVSDTTQYDPEEFDYHDYSQYKSSHVVVNCWLSDYPVQNGTIVRNILYGWAYTVKVQAMSSNRAWSVPAIASTHETFSQYVNGNYEEVSVGKITNVRMTSTPNTITFMFDYEGPYVANGFKILQAYENIVNSTTYVGYDLCYFSSDPITGSKTISVTISGGDDGYDYLATNRYRDTTSIKTHTHNVYIVADYSRYIPSILSKPGTISYNITTDDSSTSGSGSSGGSTSSGSYGLAAAMESSGTTVTDVYDITYSDGSVEFQVSHNLDTDYEYVDGEPTIATVEYTIDNDTYNNSLEDVNEWNVSGNTISMYADFQNLGAGTHTLHAKTTFNDGSSITDSFTFNIPHPFETENLTLTVYDAQAYSTDENLNFSTYIDSTNSDWQYISWQYDVYIDDNLVKTTTVTGDGSSNDDDCTYDTITMTNDGNISVGDHTLKIVATADSYSIESNEATFTIEFSE